MNHAELPIGISDFKELMTGNYFYVDKSLLIRDIIDDGAKVILLPRPRRFGKTLNMSMLYYFFDLKAYEPSLFKTLKINNTDANYLEHQGKYPVIYLSFKSIKREDFDGAYSVLTNIIAEQFRRHDSLLKTKLLDAHEKKQFNAIIQQKADRTAIELSLQWLTELLYRAHGVKAIVIIDEYDAAIMSAVANDYIKSMIALMRNVLGNVLKDNVNLKKGILTGIMRISKESIFSGINNLRTYGILSKRYGEYFGFLDEEVENLLQKAKIEKSNLKAIKNWYNGYIFAGHTVYNPWSIINYIDEECELKPYWINTSDNHLINLAFSQASSSIKYYFEELIQGHSVTRKIEENLTLQDIEHLGEQALWTLLCLSGYLKIVNHRHDVEGAHCKLAIPNKEVLSLFIKFVERWFSETINIDTYHQFVNSLTKGDCETFHTLLQRYLQESASHFDLQQKEPERVYHSLVLGMIVGLRGEYSVKSNRESGLGRYDVILLPKDPNKLGIIIEFKTAKNDDDDTLQETAKSALQQIIDKKYRIELEQAGVKKILQLGLAFSGKRSSYVSDMCL